MLLVAQRVVTAESEGINAYHHRHGQRDDWVRQPPRGVPDSDSGTLHNQLVTVRGRGRVAAYLDVAAPDAYPVIELQWGLHALGELMRLDPVLPICVISGPLYLRFEIEGPRLQAWREELQALFAACVRLIETDD